jgi:hypothetical protein
VVNDCGGWTSSLTSSYGSFWNFTAAGGKGVATACDQALRVACCK